MFARAFAIAFAVLTALAGSSRAAEVTVAVAANFTLPAREIADMFKAETGHVAQLSFGSSGQFLTQIANGAPFEIFLSADAERPAAAEAQGLAVPGSRFTYALGRLVLWSADPKLVDPAGKVLAEGHYTHLAIADPKQAPYGAAAMEVLGKLGLDDKVRDRLVTGTSIAQAFTFVQTGNAELGFVALSQVIGSGDGSRWVVPDTLHTPIAQQAVLLTTGAANPAATAFLQFLKGPKAAEIIARYGYAIP